MRAVGCPRSSLDEHVTGIDDTRRNLDDRFDRAKSVCALLAVASSSDADDSRPLLRAFRRTPGAADAGEWRTSETAVRMSPSHANHGDRWA